MAYLLESGVCRIPSSSLVGVEFQGKTLVRSIDFFDVSISGNAQDGV